MPGKESTPADEPGQGAVRMHWRMLTIGTDLKPKVEGASILEGEVKADDARMLQALQQGALLFNCFYLLGQRRM